MEAPANFDKQELAQRTDQAQRTSPAQKAIMTRDAIVDYLEGEERAEKSLSIAEALDSNVVTPETIHGRSELCPSTVRKMRRSGILPLSEKEFEDSHRSRFKKDLLAGFKLINKSFDEVKGYRVRVAYRLLRYMARVRGDLPGFSKLSTCLTGRWTIPHSFNLNEGYKLGTKGIRSLLQCLDKDPNTYTFFDGERFKTIKGGVTYLPPAIPDAHYLNMGAGSYQDIYDMRMSRQIPTDYVPDLDSQLVLYCESMEMLADHLSVHEGTELEPHAGRYGLAGLLSPKSARMAWPTLDEICMYEDGLILYIYDNLLNSYSEREVELEVMRHFGVDRDEAMDLVRMSREVGSNIYREDMEMARASLIGRMGRLAEQAASSDIRTSFAALKEQAKLKGLTRTEAESEDDALRATAIRAIEFKEDN